MRNILSKKVGVAGCGTMGLPVLRVLLENNIDAIGYDTRPKSFFEDLKDHFIENKKEFIEKNDVIISFVRDKKQTDELCVGGNGIFTSKESKLLIICSTVSPKYIKHLRHRAPKKVSIIDAPVSGAPIGAREASLTFMVGGDTKLIENIKPLLKIMGNKIHHLGPLGAGMSAKVFNNFVVACSVLSVRHVLDEAHKIEIPKERILAVLNSSSGKNWFSENFDRIDYARESYDAENTIGILEKDVYSFVDTIDNPESEEKKGNLENFYQALIEGLRNIPKFPKTIKS